MMRRGLTILLALLALVAQASASHAAWPGRNGLIVFTGEPHDDSDPDYPQNDGTDPELWTVRGNGKGLHNLTDDNKFQASALWGPRGRQLLYQCGTLPGTYSAAICRMWRDGSHRTRLIGAHAGHGAGSWSPDADHLLYTRSTRRDRGQIWKMRSDGTHRMKLTSSRFGDFTPVWSPKGHHIAFVRVENRGTSLFVMNKDGTMVRRLTNPERNVTFEEPDWSPNGEWLLYLRSTRRGTSIFTIRPDGSGATVVMRGGTGVSYPVWSPDGKKITYADGGNSAIYVMNADGTGIRRLTMSLREDLHPNWQAT
jgi:TolB protein